jgi:hypothetical protein
MFAQVLLVDADDVGRRGDVGLRVIVEGESITAEVTIPPVMISIKNA